MEDKFKKFEGIDYVNDFAKKINSMHKLVSSSISQFIVEGCSVIDVGGGPGVIASLLDALGKSINVLNIEPANTVLEKRLFKNV